MILMHHVLFDFGGADSFVEEFILTHIVFMSSEQILGFLKNYFMAGNEVLGEYPDASVRTCSGIRVSVHWKRLRVHPPVPPSVCTSNIYSLTDSKTLTKLNKKYLNLEERH